MKKIQHLFTLYNIFLFRQNEWDDYRQSHPYILQGDLSDSYYFDFISFAQYAIISESCRKPLYNFVEKVIFSSLSFVHCVLKTTYIFYYTKISHFCFKIQIGADGETQVVRRSDKYLFVLTIMI